MIWKLKKKSCEKKKIPNRRKWSANERQTVEMVMNHRILFFESVSRKRIDNTLFNYCKNYCKELEIKNSLFIIIYLFLLIFC